MSENYAVLDLETQLSAEEVGGWAKAHKMGISCGCVYHHRTIHVHRDTDIEELIGSLEVADLVVGFNIKRFDYRVLAGYTSYPFHELPTLDLMEAVVERMGYHISLDNLARATLDVGKSASGLDALRWWKEGKIQKIIDYCKRDVEVTRDLYLYGREHGRILFTNLAGQRMPIPVSWR